MSRVIGLHHLVGLLLLSCAPAALAQAPRMAGRPVETVGPSSVYVYGAVDFYDELSGLLQVEGARVFLDPSFPAFSRYFESGDLVLVFGSQIEVGGPVSAITIERIGTDQRNSAQSISGTGVSAQSISGTGKQSISGTGVSSQSISGTGKRSISGTGVSAQSISGTGISALSISGTGKQSISGTGVNAQSISGTGKQSISGTGIE